MPCWLEGMQPPPGEDLERRKQTAARCAPHRPSIRSACRARQSNTPPSSIAPRRGGCSTGSKRQPEHHCHASKQKTDRSALRVHRADSAGCGGERMPWVRSSAGHVGSQGTKKSLEAALRSAQAPKSDICGTRNDTWSPYSTGPVSNDVTDLRNAICDYPSVTFIVVSGKFCRNVIIRRKT